MAPDAAASTAVQWLSRGNLRQRLLFKEWDVFHGKVVEVHKAMTKLGEKHPVRIDVESELRRVRKVLNSPLLVSLWGKADVKDFVSR